MKASVRRTTVSSALVLALAFTGACGSSGGGDEETEATGDGGSMQTGTKLDGGSSNTKKDAPTSSNTSPDTSGSSSTEKKDAAVDAPSSDKSDTAVAQQVDAAPEVDAPPYIPTPPPAPYKFAPIGTTMTPGVVDFLGTSFTMSGSGLIPGLDNANVTDKLRDDFDFLYPDRKFTGDWEIVLRLNDFTSIDAIAKFGLMFRDKLDPVAVNAFVATTGKLLQLQARKFEKMGTSIYEIKNVNNQMTRPMWLRLQRTVDKGTNQATIKGSAAAVPMTGPIVWASAETAVPSTEATEFYAGVALSGAGKSAVQSAKFDNLTISNLFAYSDTRDWLISSMGHTADIVEYTPATKGFLILGGRGKENTATKENLTFVYTPIPKTNREVIAEIDVPSGSTDTFAGVGFRGSASPTVQNFYVTVSGDRSVQLVYRETSSGSRKTLGKTMLATGTKKVKVKLRAVLDGLSSGLRASFAELSGNNTTVQDKDWKPLGVACLNPQLVSMLFGFVVDSGDTAKFATGAFKLESVKLLPLEPDYPECLGVTPDAGASADGGTADAGADAGSDAK